MKKKASSVAKLAIGMGLALIVISIFVMGMSVVIQEECISRGYNFVVECL